MNIVTRSQYGRRLPQNLTRDVRPARILVGPVGMLYLLPSSKVLMPAAQSTPLRGTILSEGSVRVGTSLHYLQKKLDGWVRLTARFNESTRSTKMPL